MRAKKLLSSRQIFRYAVPARTVTEKALGNTTDIIHLEYADMDAGSRRCQKA